MLTLALAVVSAAPLSHARAETPDVAVELSIGKVRVLTVEALGFYTVNGQTFIGGTLTFRVSDGKVAVSHSEHGELGLAGQIRVVRADVPASEAQLTLKNSRYGETAYLGDLAVTITDEGCLRAVNEVTMEEYLCGVAGGELRASHPAEALKAQAVAAKGFALAYVENGVCRLTDTASHQVYKGCCTDASVTDAVAAVSGLTLTFCGQSVKCFYCTANGGQTLTPYMRWGGSSYEGIYALRFDPYDLAAADDAEVLTFTADPATFSAPLYAFFLERCRETLPAADAILRLDELTGYYSADAASSGGRYPDARAPQERAEAAFTVLADGRERTVRVSFPLYSLKTAGVVGGSPDTWFIQRDSGAYRIVFSKSSGHRVGMSHRGMTEMARQGFPFDQILAFYYPGATLTPET